MVKSFALLDKITIYTSLTLNPDDVNVITLLYAPLIKSDAFKLYMTLHAILNRSSLTSQTLQQKDLLDIIGMSASKFGEARLKLEAIGLLSTYQKEDEYIFMLKAPLTAKGFLSDGVLGMYLYSTVGDTEFKRIQKLFQIPKVDKTDYTEITASFDEVFESVEDIEITNDEYIIDRKLNLGIKIKNHHFDFELFASTIAKTFLEGKRITKRFETFIINIAYAYGFNEEQMNDIYNKSFNSSNYFDYLLCSKRAREKYAELHEKPLPSLNVKDDVTKSELEEIVESLTAKDLIEQFTGVGVASGLDIENVERLYQEYIDIPRAVLNVCVIASIKACDGKTAAFNYYDKKIKDWILNGRTTFDLVKEFITSDKPNTNNNSKKKKPTKKIPDWLKEYEENIEEGVVDL